MDRLRAPGIVYSDETGPTVFFSYKFDAKRDTRQLEAGKQLAREWANRKTSFSLAFKADDPPQAIVQQTTNWAKQNRLTRTGHLVLHLSVAYWVLSWELGDDVDIYSSELAFELLKVLDKLRLVDADNVADELEQMDLDDQSALIRYLKQAQVELPQTS